MLGWQTRCIWSSSSIQGWQQSAVAQSGFMSTYRGKDRTHKTCLQSQSLFITPRSRRTSPHRLSFNVRTNSDIHHRQRSLKKTHLSALNNQNLRKLIVIYSTQLIMSARQTSVRTILCSCRCRTVNEVTNLFPFVLLASSKHGNYRKNVLGAIGVRCWPLHCVRLMRYGGYSGIITLIPRSHSYCLSLPLCLV